MNLVFTLVLGAAVLLLAVFLWPLRRHRSRTAEERPLQFKEELAEELAIPDWKPEEPRPAPPMEPELPQAYGIDRLVLLVRDPQWLYAYWEVSATKQEEFNSNFGLEAWNSSRPVLRVYEVAGDNFNGTNASCYTDINLGVQDDNWHINVGKANSTFCVDLGRVFADGRFITLLRSNIVTTPRESLSDVLDEEWMWIEGVYRTLSGVSYGMSSPMLAEQMGLKKDVMPLGISSPGVTSPSGSSPGAGQSWR